MTTKEAIAWFENRRCAIVMPGAAAMYDMAIAALRAQQEAEKNEPKTICDLCAYSPPSSLDGKPCCMFPAVEKYNGEE